jgi:phosphate transport system permease protein
MGLRLAADRGLTGLAAGSVILVAAALLVILGPMLWQGAGAVVFEGTVEFRRMQLERHGRGDAARIEAETAAAWQARQPVYDLLQKFRRGLDTQDLQEEARFVYTELGKQLANRDMETEARLAVRRFARSLRDELLAAYESGRKAEALARLDAVLAHEGDARLKGTVGERFFAMARQYRQTVSTVNLSLRQDYAQALADVLDAVQRLFGPRPGEPRPELTMFQYGSTRMDMARRALDDLLYAEKWEPAGPGRPLLKRRIPRQEQFAGTDLAALFPMVRQNLDAMLLPRTTVYWQYFMDDSIPGHFFGGVGPEILGTLALTVLSVLFAFPVGVITAAWLVEAAGEGRAVRTIRLCINTLAGVPSIVFGLFGLALFVGYLLDGRQCVLAASLTLAVLILPVIIRASEEAIRAVPPAYKEAALALGASRLRCFLTVQLPAAMPGILTGLILSMSRAAGETAPILFTGAVAVGSALKVFGDRWPFLTLDWLSQPTRALSYGGFDLAVNDKVAAMVPHQQYGMVMTLVALVLLLNVAAIGLRWRISRKLRGQ